jgi:purine-binding chemotaxis protein CheW
MKQAVFQLNGEEYGLDILDISTVEQDMDIKKMTNSPSNVKGKINLRGKDIPVYSLRRKFGIEDKKQDTDTRHLIINVQGMDIAFEVDQVMGILDLDPSVIYDVPPVVKSHNTSYIKSVAKVSDGLILLLDSRHLVEDEEMKALQTVGKK